jgi:hypothetical protein
VPSVQFGWRRMLENIGKLRNPGQMRERHVRGRGGPLALRTRTYSCLAGESRGVLIDSWITARSDELRLRNFILDLVCGSA